MVEEIKLPKIVSSVSTAGRINKVKRRESNANEDRFHRQLHEEQKKEEQTDDEQPADFKQEKVKRAKVVSAVAGSDHDEYDDDMNKDQGRLVDVVI